MEGGYVPAESADASGSGRAPAQPQVQHAAVPPATIARLATEFEPPCATSGRERALALLVGEMARVLTEAGGADPPPRAPRTVAAQGAMAQGAMAGADGGPARQGGMAQGALAQGAVAQGSSPRIPSPLKRLILAARHAAEDEGGGSAAPSPEEGRPSGGGRSGGGGLLRAERAPAASPSASVGSFLSPSARSTRSGMQSQDVIVVADDEASLRRAHQRLLLRCGRVSTLSFVNGREVVDDVAQWMRDGGRPSDYCTLFMLDNEMPELRGVDAAAALRRLGVTTPIVLVSGTLDDAVRTTAAANGVTVVVAKPLSLATARMCVAMAACGGGVAASDGGRGGGGEGM
jgi:CheY-like chemotaxis protein